MKKIRCKNCGTIIKETDFSCPICHMKPERTEEETKKVEDNIIHKKNNTLIFKVIITVLFAIGIILTVIGFIHMNDMTYCMSSNCSVKNLFMIVIGLTLTLASLITLIKFRNK